LLEEAEEDAAWSANRLADGYARVSEQVGITIKDRERLNELISVGLIRFDEETAKWVRTLIEVEDQTESIFDAVGQGGLAYDSLTNAISDLREGQQVFFDEATGKAIRFGEGLDIIPDRLKGIGVETQTVRIGMEEIEDVSNQWIETIEGGVPTFKQAGRAASTAFEESKQSAEDAIRASADYIIKMEELASNERIKLIESTITLNVAQIEADTRRAEAAFESLNAGIMSTGETITGLAGLFLEAERGSERWKIEDIIKEERELREQQFDLQKQLVQSEIDLNRERANMMARGDALIQIDGAGLAPHLEAFMWETLRAIQVRVNEDGLDMLLGAGA
jgi:hypothetical protein